MTGRLTGFSEVKRSRSTRTTAPRSPPYCAGDASVAGAGERNKPEPSAEDPVGGLSSDSDDEPTEGEAVKASSQSPEDKLVKVSPADRRHPQCAMSYYMSVD